MLVLGEIGDWRASTDLRGRPRDQAREHFAEVPLDRFLQVLARRLATCGILWRMPRALSISFAIAVLVALLPSAMFGLDGDRDVGSVHPRSLGYKWKRWHQCPGYGIGVGESALAIRPLPPPSVVSCSPCLAIP